MSLGTLIEGTRKAIAEDAANAHVVFAAQGTLDLFKNPVSRTLGASG